MESLLQMQLIQQVALRCILQIHCNKNDCQLKSEGVQVRYQNEQFYLESLLNNLQVLLDLFQVEKAIFISFCHLIIKFNVLVLFLFHSFHKN